MHLEALKDAAKDFEAGIVRTEKEIEKVDYWLDVGKYLSDHENVNYFPNAISFGNFGALQWPSGSNPCHRTDDRREEENNDGWVR